MLPETDHLVGWRQVFSEREQWLLSYKYVDIICSVTHENMRNETEDDKVMAVRKMTDHKILASREFESGYVGCTNFLLQACHWYIWGTQSFATKDFYFSGEGVCWPPCMRGVLVVWWLAASTSWGAKCPRSMTFSRRKSWSRGLKHPMATEVGLEWKETGWTRWVEKETSILKGKKIMKSKVLACGCFGLKFVLNTVFHFGFKAEYLCAIYIFFAPNLNTQDMDGREQSRR